MASASLLLAAAPVAVANPLFGSITGPAPAPSSPAPQTPLAPPETPAAEKPVTPPVVEQPPISQTRAQMVIDRARSQVGVPYAWGGGNIHGPTRGIRDGGVADRHGDFNKIGFDCSGLLVYSFAGAGVFLPRTSGDIFRAGAHVPLAQRKPGDVLFYGPGGSHHAALYIGNGMVIESPYSGATVRIAPINWSGIQPVAVRFV
ncbi:NlpC/P60 family protein [Lolliginicoccus levis]|uniref:NlpC/P60 family protein n=1 Tax=Lolliginicoccus levis TaxID=2919542 RepID=UPI00241CCA0B|nr:NlpC/P60 family protein [Lolliginicoccus levis]